MNPDLWSALQSTEPILEGLSRWIGVLIAVLGAGLSAPHGVKRLAANPTDKIVQGLRAMRSWLAKFIPCFQKSEEIHAGVANMMLTATGGTAFGRSSSWSPDADIEVRVSQLRDHLLSVEKYVEHVDSQVNQRVNKVSDDLVRLEQKHEQTSESLKATIHATEHQALEVEATGLPLIASGIVLSGISQELAAVAPIGWIVLLAGIAIATCMTIKSVKSGIWKSTADGV